VAREIKQHKNASTCTHSKNVQNGWLKLKFKTLFWNLLKIVNDTILYSMCLESRTCYVIVFQVTNYATRRDAPSRGKYVL